MPKYEELNGTQQELYGKLQAAMEEHENIIDLLTGFSKEDLLKILTTANIKIKLSNGQEYTSTPLVHAIILNKQRGIQAILNVAKRNSILEKVLTTANIKIRLSDDQEHTLTPLGCAINLINQEVSQKSIKAIIDVAQDNDMLEKVFASIKKDHLNKTKNILEILKNQEQDEEQKAKIDGWLKILAKSISSCESKDDPNKIEMHDRVEEICKKQEQEDWKVTLERIVPNHENKDKCEIFSKIFNKETFKVSLDPQRNADMITLIKKNQPDYESKEQSLVDESSIPKTEGNITKDTVKTTNKPIIIGSVCGAIAELAVGLGLYFGAALPVLPIIGIAIAAAVVVGLIAGGITYVISKPSENLDRANVEQRVSIGLTA
ncbi:magnesium transporter [Wolbachia endosymbiont of Nasonia vitripennis]|uniref:WD_0033/WD_0034 family tandem repeat-containing protein n=1 Tax=Wolbachia endosymbiont of Nasonia vitripennis TaxID=180837 RepID=UPI003A83E856